jgi:hypothetical protein
MTILSGSTATRVFMTASAIGLGSAALALIFAPDVVLAAAGAAATPVTLVLAQLYGAALAGIATATWVARHALLGGIFGRAVVTGGATHGIVGALALARGILTHAPHLTSPTVWVALAVYGVLACGFGALMFGPTPSAP